MKVSFYMMAELFVVMPSAVNAPASTDDLRQCNIGATSLTGAVVSCVILV